jgi:AraC-like DNA-binding protein
MKSLSENNEVTELYRECFPNADTFQDRTYLSDGQAASGSSMTIHRIFPGVHLIFNRFNSKECIEPVYPPFALETLEINHCRQGRFGCLLPGDNYVYLGEGELEVNILGIERLKSEFPLGFYDGASVLVSVPEAVAYFKPIFPEVAEQLLLLKEQVKHNAGVMLIRQTPAVQKAFEELYRTDSILETDYCKLKILEILLTMQPGPVDRGQNQTTYFKRSDLEKVKGLRNEAVLHLDRRIPFARLAENYGIALTTAKHCFKEVYGMPYYTYMKHYRMHKALHYLDEKEKTVTQISSLLGYDNASKFSAAFKSVLGCTPREYQKHGAQMEHYELLGVELE